VGGVAAVHPSTGTSGERVTASITRKSRSENVGYGPVLLSRSPKLLGMGRHEYTTLSGETHEIDAGVNYVAVDGQ